MNAHLSFSNPPALELHYSGPTLEIQKHKISKQVADFKASLPTVTPHYAVKANPLPEVIQHLAGLGVNFEIASQGELNLLQTLGIDAKRIIFSHPIKTPSSISAAVDYGIEWFAFDNQEELIKLCQLAPDSNYELRISTNGQGSVWPLSKKFGMDIQQAMLLIDFAHEQNVTISGLTFHVGSQCTQSQSWLTALSDCTEIIEYMMSKNMPLSMLNIGGGFPTDTRHTPLSLQQLMEPVNQALNKMRDDLKSKYKLSIHVCAEPGRFLVASSGVLTCQIISTTIKHHQHWAYLDCGYYNGLMELTEDFGYTLNSQRSGKSIPWVIAGPTCDSIDCFDPLYQLPNDCQAGDVIQIENMGAYVNTCVTQFNGFEGPTVFVSE